MHSFYKRSTQGIGLLELMLSLAIIAVLLIMATRYYQSASENNKRNDAVDMFSAVNGAVQSWKVDQDPSVLGEGVQMSGLISGGYLPPSYGSDATGVAPWGGNIRLSDFGSGKYTISMSGVPSNSCAAVATRVNSTIAAAGALSGASTPSAVCGSDGESVDATYNY